MFRYFCKSKIHRATVTGANVEYMGSITVSTDLLEATGLYPYEKVQVVDVDNGARLETYVIPAEGSTGEICLNGAAARLVNVGDKVIIISYCMLSEEEIAKFKPIVVFVDDDNKITLIEEKEPCFKTHLQLIAESR